MDNGIVDAGAAGFCIRGYRASSTPIAASQHAEVFAGAYGNNRRVLIKRAAPNPESRSMLKAEAEALKAIARIPIAAVPTYVDFVEENGDLALVEEFIDGQPLAIPRRGENFTRLRPYEVRRFLDHILQTVREIHRQGYVHNDIEPGNILCRPHDPVQPFVLIDFDKAIRRGAAGRYRTSGAVDPAIPPGPFAYNAPELAGSPGYYTSDLYSLGVIAIQLLTGARLTDLSWNSHGHIVLPLYPFTRDPVLERVLVTMTCCFPGQRYQDADEVIAGLVKRDTGEILDKPVEKRQTGRLVLAFLLFILFVYLASVAWKSAMAEYCRQSIGCSPPASTPQPH